MIIDTIIQALWIIPVEPENVTLENHAIAIQNGRILDILPIDDAKIKYQPLTHLDLNQHVLIPGLVNCHTHSAMAYLRGVADDIPLMEWLNHHIWPLEQKWVSEQFVSDASELAIAEMLRCGTTCFNDMYFFPEATAQVAIKAGIRTNIGLILVDFPSAWAQNADEYLSKGLTLHDELNHETLVTTGFAPHAPYTVSDHSFERLRTIANELDLTIHIHLHETAQEINESIKHFDMRPIERLDKLGVLGPSLIAAHMTQLNEKDIDLFSQSGASIAHCPESNLKLASGFCPIARLIDQGINVALGTDSVASNNDLDMLGETKTAALLAKGVAQDARAVPAHDALKMATLNGAKALRIDDEIGSLKVGKSADITAIQLNAIEASPLYDPVSHVIYSASRNQVSDVWIAGKQLLKCAELTTIDRAAICEKAADWKRRLIED